MSLTASQNRSGIALVGFIAACEAVSMVSGWLTAPEVDGWHRTLAKPSFVPPDTWFAPVWTALFALMGTAAWLVWRAPASPARTAGLRLFCIQLALNFLWSMIFFRGHALLSAVFEIVLLLLAIVATAVLFGRVSRAAAWLMAPYAAWVGFATVLTWAIWRLNS